MIIHQTQNLETDYTYEQYRIANEKYKKGRATLLEVQEKELLMKNAEWTYYKHLVMKVKLEFIFDNYVYGMDYTT